MLDSEKKLSYQNYADKLVSLMGERNRLIERRNQALEKVQKLSKGSVNLQDDILIHLHQPRKSSLSQADTSLVNKLKKTFANSLSNEITERVKSLSGFAEKLRSILNWLPPWFIGYEAVTSFVEKQDVLQDQISKIDVLKNHINSIPDNSKLDDPLIGVVLEFWRENKDDLQLSIHTGVIDFLLSIKDEKDLMETIQQYENLIFECGEKEQEILDVEIKLKRLDVIQDQAGVSKKNS